MEKPKATKGVRARSSAGDSPALSQGLDYGPNSKLR